MLTSEMLLDAMSGIRESDIEKTAMALGYLQRPQKGRGRILRSVLIAAVIGSLLTATAVGTTIWRREERLAPMPTNALGQELVVEIPNGFKGTPTYQGSAEWWAFMAEWENQHGWYVDNYEMDFIKDDLDKFLVCQQYSAYEEEQADKLYEIAEKYHLKLYKECVYFNDNEREGEGREQFFALSGVEPFLDGDASQRMSGYVFEDGSFSLESSFTVGGKPLDYRLFRIRSGSIYPYGGAGLPTEYEEVPYENRRGQQVVITLFHVPERDDTASVTYVSPDGDTYLEMNLDNFGAPEDLDWVKTAKAAADLVDFQALCVRNEGAKAVLDVPTGAEDNRTAVEKVQDFQNSPVFQAGKKFQEFYTQHFYGNTYSGTYGVAGYEDLDAELTALSEEYGLKIARTKTKGNAFSPDAEAYDNGAWLARVLEDKYGNADTLHYIPKDALYTRMVHFLDIGQYRRVWEYQTKDGTELVLFTQGPEKISGSYALCETRDAYILLSMGGGLPQDMQRVVDEIDWAKLTQ